jgi:hypothetical protein
MLDNHSSAHEGQWGKANSASGKNEASALGESTSASVTAVSTKANLAGEQLSLDVGLLKQSINMMGYAVSFNVAGPQTIFDFTIGQKHIGGHSTTLCPTNNKTVLTSIEKKVSELTSTLNKTNEHGLLDTQCAMSFNVSVGGNRISVTPGGVTIESAALVPIMLDGNVHVTKNLSVGGNLYADGSGAFTGDLGSKATVQGKQGFFKKMLSDSVNSDFALPPNPFLFAEAEVAITSAKALLEGLKVAIKTADGYALSIKEELRLAEAALKTAQAAMGME